MSDTPRTDALETYWCNRLDKVNDDNLGLFVQQVCMAMLKHAHQLELENNSLREQLAGQRNKVLEEAAKVIENDQRKVPHFVAIELNYIHDAILALRTTQPAKEKP